MGRAQISLFGATPAAVSTAQGPRLSTRNQKELLHLDGSAREFRELSGAIWGFS